MLPHTTQNTNQAQPSLTGSRILSLTHRKVLDLMHCTNVFLLCPSLPQHYAWTTNGASPGSRHHQNSCEDLPDDSVQRKSDCAVTQINFNPALVVLSRNSSDSALFPLSHWCTGAQPSPHWWPSGLPCWPATFLQWPLLVFWPHFRGHPLLFSKLLSVLVDFRGEGFHSSPESQESFGTCVPLGRDCTTNRSSPTPNFSHVFKSSPRPVGNPSFWERKSSDSSSTIL